MLYKYISVKGYVMALRQLVTSLSLWRPGFDDKPVHMGLVADQVAVGQVFLQVLQFSLISIIPQMPPIKFCVILKHSTILSHA
jgi:hypothetical protein